MKTFSSLLLCRIFINWKLVLLPMLSSNFQTNILLVCIIYSYNRLSTLVQTMNYISVLCITFTLWPPLHPCTTQDPNLWTSTLSFNTSITVGYHINKGQPEQILGLRVPTTANTLKLNVITRDKQEDNRPRKGKMDLKTVRGHENHMPHRTIFRCGHNAWCFKYMNHRCHRTTRHTNWISKVYYKYTTKYLPFFPHITWQVTNLRSVALCIEHTPIRDWTRFTAGVPLPALPQPNFQTLPRPYLVTDNVLIQRERYVIDLICICRFYSDHSWFQVEVRGPVSLK